MSKRKRKMGGFGSPRWVHVQVTGVNARNFRRALQRVKEALREPECHRAAEALISASYFHGKLRGHAESYRRPSSSGALRTMTDVFNKTEDRFYAACKVARRFPK